ncbi:MAG: hypothetical protein JWQ38_3361 [Flavipsychrobacter sp.]|nr:hypothetical protein [Flavipsychrobacter sp.]
MRASLIILLLSVIGFASCKKKQEDVLAGIKKHTAEINNKLKDYTLKKVDDITSPGGGHISGYYRDDEIKKITAQHFSDSNRVFTDYYFDEGMLIFVLQQDFIYNRHATYTEEVARAAGDSVWYDDKKTRMEVSRFYLNENKLIKWIDAQNADVAVNSPFFPNKQSELWAQAAVLIKELKEQ